MSLRHRAVAAVPVTEPGAHGRPDDPTATDPIGTDPIGTDPIGMELIGMEPIGVEPVAPAPAYVDDGLAAELARAEPRRWRNRATPWLVAAVLLVGGFAAGAQTQRTYGPQASSATTAGRTGGQFGGRTGGFPGTGSGASAAPGGNRASGGGSPAAGASAAPGGPATTGTVKLVDGSTLYVQTGSGDVITVRTNGATAVQVPGKLGELKPGDRVSVQGQPAGDGELTASAVTGGR